MSWHQIGSLQRRPGADPALLAALEPQLPKALPDDYLAFLKETNGVEGFISSNSYLSLWPADEIPKLNQGYAVNELAPGLVLLGTNGGNTGYGFRRQASGVEYVRVPLVGLSDQAAEPLGTTLEQFLHRLMEQ